MAVSLRVLQGRNEELTKNQKHFRLSEITEERLNKLEARLEELNQTGIVELAIKHLLATLQHGERVFIQVPDEPLKAHKPRITEVDSDHHI